MKKKIEVTVIMGGRSSEHEVSMISGREVVRQLNKTKYKATSLVIAKDGGGMERIFKIKTDIVFIALHGRFGEDGIIQGILELTGISYTGSKVLASAIGMDKYMFRKLMKYEHLPIPKYVMLSKGEKYTNFRKVLGEMPYFIKPVNGGSSLGVFLIKSAPELNKYIKTAFEYDDRVLVDEFVKGTEITCGVIGNNNPVALPVIEILPLKSSFFDYKSKYSNKGSKEIVPARISKELTNKVQQISIDVYKLVGCRGFARIDFILRNGKDPVILEINTIPGLTPVSLMPKAASAAGISYSNLLDNIIEYALEK